MNVVIGDSIPRREDGRFLLGQGQYLDDLQMPGLLHAQVVRSPHAHARILGIDAKLARGMPGVRLVLTAADLLSVGPIPLDFAPPGAAGSDPAWPAPLQPALAADFVRYAGEPVAFVVADTHNRARDAAEAVEIDYEELPPVILTGEAATAGISIWPEFPRNVAFRHELGDAAATEAALAAAHHVVRTRFVQQRVIASPLEPRSAIGEYDKSSGRLTLHVGTQRPHGFKQTLVEQVLHLAADELRVISRDVGGGFGTKNSLYPEYILCLKAARLLGVAVKWLCTRSEAMISDQHARDNVFDLELGVDRDGRIRALRGFRIVNLGAYASPRTFIPTYNGLALLAGIYKMAAAYVQVEGVFSNTLPTTVYRGAGRPEVVQACESLIDLAAGKLGLDPLAMRRVNGLERSDHSCTNALGASFLNVEFKPVFDKALQMIGHDGLPARREAARRSGRLHGFGVSWFVENLHGPAKTKPAWLRARGDQEGFEVVVGTVSNGQGHETSFTQIVADRLGMPIESMRFVQGDTDTVPEATGTGASWSLTLMGSSLALAVDDAIAKGKVVSSALLEVNVDDIEYAEGAFRIAGTDRLTRWRDIFRAVPGFTATGHFDNYHEGFPAACHACEVEVDPDTGVVALRRYVVAQDAGRIVNPLLAQGQLHGGVAQGIGQALMEEVRYDAESGQLTSGSFMDYGLPRADDLPDIECLFVEGPPGDNPLGVKGIGEAGATGAPPCVVNAVMDALRPMGVSWIDMPLAPMRVWRALRDARTGGAAVIGKAQ